MSEQLDAGIGRINRRIQQRREDTRSRLKAQGMLDLAEALRDAFGASLIWLKTPEGELGSPIVKGLDLSKPGVTTWTQYIPPKRRKGSV